MAVRGKSGFTAIELLAVIAIVGVLMATTAPLLGFALNEADAAASSRLLHNHLYLARSTAIARRADVVVCAAEGQSCTQHTDWSNGWWVFIDNNRNRRIDSGDTRLRYGEALRGKIRIRQGSGGRGRSIRFKPAGDAWPSTTFSVCANADSQSARAVVVYYTGRVRISANRPGNRKVACDWY